ncbi:hypothetical protein Poli38472_004277 [Pythium oligandrum]|uniref:Uncharacterized protein n=1 Tax=Pythium oligandrum TaxID=41045 RepID=A0A8K1FP39_PYTOL|nr:hypothetical protein Poli38472_004277 [Pythium oligandrum]|eukprot:TMW66512.1 hypothetical protein Poli38472_004277 [Pythium oligandrum]
MDYGEDDYASYEPDPPGTHDHAMLSRQSFKLLKKALASKLTSAKNAVLTRKQSLPNFRASLSAMTSIKNVLPSRTSSAQTYETRSHRSASAPETASGSWYHYEKTPFYNQSRFTTSTSHYPDFWNDNQAEDIYHSTRFSEQSHEGDAYYTYAEASDNQTHL